MSPGSGVVSPVRGEVWEVNLNPTVGHEQAGRRPALIVSDNALNSGPRGLVVVVPITGTARGLPTHVPVVPPHGGLTKPSVIMTALAAAWAWSQGRRWFRSAGSCCWCLVFDGTPAIPTSMMGRLGFGKGGLFHVRGEKRSSNNKIYARMSKNV
jgi:mRNA-degrading endonuclease toxin of MazEF toxin-antitoxin module